ncbi:MAG: SOS response-associated peptidase [Desulfuromonadaceae bacterium]|nr:SOS response-associated peptidase [Desulfuromonadaceae bacterium]
MCGRFVTMIPYEELKQLFDLTESSTRIEPKYNVAPAQQVSVVRSNGEHNVLTPMRWGLIPAWSKDASIAGHTINARCETVAEKPSFRHAIKYNRCIIPISGFYEWSHSGGTKTPHYIYLTENVPMSLAGIWEHWKAPDGGEMETFSIVTTTSNSLIQPLHDRMPVILQPADCDLWLSKNVHNPHELTPLYQPYPADEMMLHEVSRLVNNTRFDSPSCIEKV